MKVLFLDIDGVLNSTNTLHEIKASGQEGIGDAFLAILADIVAKTGCEIVLSSDWRHDSLDIVERRLAAFGIKLLGHTPYYTGGPRAAEIEAWLKDHIAVTKYAVVDDCPDAGWLSVGDNFFQTTMSKGITSDIAERIIAHLL